MTGDHELTPAALVGAESGVSDDALFDVDSMVDLAKAALQEYTHDRWVEVSDRVLDAALHASRRSHPVRAETDSSVQVSAGVLVAYLREAIDGAVPGTAVHQIDVTVTGDDTFESVIVQIIARYGLPLVPAADRIRDITTGVVDALLGRQADDVNVRVTHVHIGDVTRGDPATTDQHEQDR